MFAFWPNWVQPNVHGIPCSYSSSRFRCFVYNARFLFQNRISLDFWFSLRSIKRKLWFLQSFLYKQWTFATTSDWYYDLIFAFDERDRDKLLYKSVQSMRPYVISPFYKISGGIKTAVEFKGTSHVLASFVTKRAAPIVSSKSPACPWLNSSRTSFHFFVLLLEASNSSFWSEFRFDDTILSNHGELSDDEPQF